MPKTRKKTNRIKHKARVRAVSKKMLAERKSQEKKAKRKLSPIEQWEAFQAWHKSERAKFAFVPDIGMWRNRALAMGIPVTEFNSWAKQFQWWSDDTN